MKSNPRCRENMKSRERDIDQGYAWVALVAAFCIQMIAGILTYSPGVTNIAILEQVENDLSKTSWIGSTLFGTYALLGPVAGLIQNRVGPRITTIAGGIVTLTGLTAAFFCQTVVGLIITYGFVAGFGICLGGNVVGVVPGQYFDKRRPVAYGLCMAGGAMGLFISGPLTRYLLPEYGIHGTLLVLGAVAFHMCIAGVLFRAEGPVRSHSLTVGATEADLQASTSVVVFESKSGMLTDIGVLKEKKERTRDYSVESDEACLLHRPPTDTAVLEKNSNHDGTEYTHDRLVSATSGDEGVKRQKSNICNIPVPNLVAFIIYNISITLWSLGESACMFHLPNYVQLKGSTLTQAASLFTAIGTGGLFSRPVTGLIASDSSIGYTTLHVGLAGIAGALSLLFPFYSYTYSLQLVYSVLYGVYNQGINSLYGPITIDLIGLSNVAIGFGFVYFSSGIGYFLGPPIASFLYSATGSYDNTFIFTGICLILSSVSTAATSVLKRK